MTTLKRLRNRSPQRARNPRQGGQWTPQRLGLYVSYDANDSGSSTQITDLSGNARAAMTLGATTAAPTWLPYTTPSVYLPGGAGNYVQCGNLTHTGDFTGRFLYTHSTALAISTELFGDRAGTTGEATLRLGTAAITEFNMIWFESAVAKQQVSTAHGLSNGQTAWIGVERINNNGGVYRIRFYKSSAASPSTTDWTGWTLISSHDGAAVAAPTVSTSNFTVGGATIPLTGIVSRCITTNNGTTTADFDASLCGQTGYTDSLGNVWAPARATSGLKPVVSSGVANSTTSKYLAATDDYFTGPSAAVPPATAGASCSMWSVVRPWATQVANNVVFSTRSGTGAGVTLRLASATTMVADVSDGSTTVTTPAVTFTPGQRLVAGVILTGGAPGTAAVFINSTIGSTVARNGTTETGGALYVCSNSTPTNFAALEVRVPFQSCSRALVQGEVDRLSTYFGGGL